MLKLKKLTDKTKEPVLSVLAEFKDEILEVEQVHDVDMVDKYIWMVKRMESSVEYLKKKSTELKDLANAVEDKITSFKLFLRNRLGDDTVFGTTGKIVPATTKRSTVIEEKLTPSEYTYNIKCSYEVYQKLKELYEGLELDTNVTKTPFGVKMLGDGHPAIDVKETETVTTAKLSKKDAAYVATYAGKKQIESIPESWLLEAEMYRDDRERNLQEDGQTETPHDEFNEGVRF